jgi:hypothetical protein
VIIEWAADGTKAQQKFTDRIEKLKDRALQAEEIVRLIADFVRSPEPGSSGFMLTATRNEELTGVQISIRLIPMTAAGATQDWKVEENVVVGTKSVLSSGGAGSKDGYQDPDDWNDLREAVMKATSAAAETPFQIQVRIEHE